MMAMTDVAFRPEHLERRSKPTPDRVIGPRRGGESGGVNNLPPIHLYAGILAGWDEACEYAGGHHQNEDNDDCLEKGFCTDLGT